MSRLDRLVRTVGPHLADAENLLTSVLGRRADGRGHAALVATDQRLLLLTEGFTRTMIEDLAYGDITAFTLTDEGSDVVVEVVATEARWRLEHVDRAPATTVALALMAERCRRTAAAAGPTARSVQGPPARVKVLPAGTA